MEKGLKLLKKKEINCEKGDVEEKICVWKMLNRKKVSSD
jgi:hypothetical protein